MLEIRRILVPVLGLLIGLVAGGSAHAAVLRYLLVIGNDHGVEASGLARPDLTHAEAEAATLYRALLANAGFSGEPRSLLLQGADRQGVLAAVARLAAQVERDRATFPDVEVMFAVFYSGHGSEGSLLLADGPLAGAELARAMRAVRADMRVGVFDACASASLSPAMIAAKGMKPIHGLDLLKELPEDALDEKGSVWIFSSAADEVSIEDKQLGGVFTHYFIQGLSGRAGGGRSVTLDEVWAFARARTIAHTSRIGLTQTPTKTTNTVSTGPLEFAWPDRRRATLVLEPELESRIALYHGDDLVMVFDKAPGKRLEKSVPAGAVELVMFRGDARSTRRLALAHGDRVIVAKGEGWVEGGLGRVHRMVSPKGAAIEDALVVHEESGPTLALGLGYGIAATSDIVLAPRHAVALALRADLGDWMLAGAFATGWDRHAFESWSYTSRAYECALRLGYHVLGGTWLVTPVVSGRLGVADQDYAGGPSRDGLYGALGGGLVTALQWRGVGVLELSAVVSALRARGVGVTAAGLWSVDLSIGAAFLFEL